MSESGKATIHVVDDDNALRDALTGQLRCAGYEVCTYGSAGEFLVKPPPTGHGCILLDLELPGPSGLTLQRALQRMPDALPVVFMSGRNDVASAVTAMKAGAVDFLLKPFDTDVLLCALEAALSLRESRAAPRAPSVSLSERERFVLSAIAGGLRNKEIAHELHLSERTIKHCRAELMRRFEARSLADLLRHAAPLVGQAFDRPRAAARESRLRVGVQALATGP